MNTFLCISDKNQVFGWGNSEYNQLDLSGGIQQINTPIHLKMTEECGKIVDVANGGSACMVLNGILVFSNIKKNLNTSCIQRKNQHFWC